jgi:hypothetical protein
VNPQQGGFYVTQQGRLAVRVSNRQIPFRRALNLIHGVRTRLDYDAVPLSQELRQLKVLPFKDILEPVHRGT